MDEDEMDAFLEELGNMDNFDDEEEDLDIDDED